MCRCKVHWMTCLFLGGFLFSWGFGTVRASEVLVIENGKGVGAGSGQGEEDDRQDEVLSTLLKRIDAVCQSILEHHIDAPTSQSLYLAATRAVYRTLGEPSPQNLGSQFSKLSTTAQLQSALVEHWETASKSGPDDLEGLGRSALHGMLSSVNLANQFDPLVEQDHVAKQLSENQYIGIGIALRMDDEYSEITNPIIGGPAHRAGAKEGDLILKIDGKPTDGWNIGKVVTVLRGPIDSKVSVVVRNKSGGDERKLDMVRTTVPIPSVHGVKQHDDESWQISFKQHPKIAYLRLSDIVGSSAAELFTFGLQAENENAKAIILDLRGDNPQPPELHHAIMVADSVVGEMKVGSIRYPDQSTEVATQAESAFGELPMVVIANARVHGHLGIVLAALRKRPNTQFVGTSAIESQFYCYDRVALPDRQGAIRAMPVGRFTFQIDPTLIHRNRGRHASLPSLEQTAARNGRLYLPVDHVVLADGANQTRAPHVTRISHANEPDFLVRKAINVINQGSKSSDKD